MIEVRAPTYNIYCKGCVLIPKLGRLPNSTEHDSRPTPLETWRWRIHDHNADSRCIGSGIVY